MKTRVTKVEFVKGQRRILMKIFGMEIQRRKQSKTNRKKGKITDLAIGSV